MARSSRAIFRDQSRICSAWITAARRFGLFLERVPQPAQYIVHARGDDRNRVDVYFGDRIASYLEDGDASSWATAAPLPAADAVAAWIDAQRVPRAAAP